MHELDPDRVTAAPDRGLPVLARTATAAFADRFGGPPTWIVAAPGRVNLIGDHTDYNGGFVLPMAIDRYVVIAAAPAAGNGASRVRIHSAALNETATIPLDQRVGVGEPRWSNYVRGVIAGFQRRGTIPPAVDALVVSEVPVGGGLSSSAALEVAIATLLEAVTETSLSNLEKARLCRRAEHEFARVPCGIMDQLASVLGDEAGPLLIDCASEIGRVVRFADPDLSVLICDSKVRHALDDGEYAYRREQCHQAARQLGVATLRGATPEMVDDARDVLGDLHHRRARHVVTENARTLAAAAALEAFDARAAGALMYESHRSLRDDFEVSCPELDSMVEAAQRIGVKGGVFGARMTGGGFGGCMVTLVQTDRVERVVETLTQHYGRQHGAALSAFLSRPARGAHMIRSSNAL